MKLAGPLYPSEFEPRGGAIAFKADDGVWICANPGQPMFSTVTMSASHYFKDDEWQPIYEDKDEQT